ncbi:hypothetical protein IE077_000835, partial [Cardiosporidium cionae]
ILQESLRLLLYKLESFLRLDPPANDRFPLPLCIIDELIDFQELGILQLLIDLCATIGISHHIEDVLCRFIDTLSARRPKCVQNLFNVGFHFSAIPHICRSLSFNEHLLPWLSFSLNSLLRSLWIKEASDKAFDTAIQNTTITPGLTAALHPALQPFTRIQKCHFYMKCLITLTCDIRDNTQYNENQDSNPVYCAETVNSLFLESLKYVHTEPSVAEFVKDVIPTMSILILEGDLKRLIEKDFQHQAEKQSKHADA